MDKRIALAMARPQLNAIIILSLMFSSFAVLPIDSEFQPVGLALAGLLMWSHFSRHRAISYHEGLVLVAVLTGTVLTLVTGKFVAASVEVLVGLLGYLILRYSTRKKILTISPALGDGVIVAMAVLAVIQVLVPHGVSVQVSAALSQIIPRHWFGQLPGGRGVSLLFSEPAHAAKLIFLLMNFYFIRLELGQYSKKRAGVLALFLLLLIVTNSSGSIIMMVLFAASAYAATGLLSLVKSGRMKLLYVLFISLVTPVLFILITQVERFQSKIYALFTLSFSVNDFIALAGIRLVSVYFGFLYSVSQFFPAGLGQSRYKLIDFMSQNGVDVANIWFLQVTDFRALQANSFAAQTVADLGLIGYVIIAAIIGEIWKTAAASNLSSARIFSLCYIVLLILNSNLLPIHLWLGVFLPSLIERSNRPAKIA